MTNRMNKIRTPTNLLIEGVYSGPVGRFDTPHAKLFNHMGDLTYRQALPEETGQILALLEAGGLHWPGPTATPYVAVRADGEVVAAFFKTLCFHAEPLVATPGANFSVTELARPMRKSFQALADAEGYPIAVMSLVQDNPAALEAARKNGLVRMDGITHRVVIEPRDA